MKPSNQSFNNVFDSCMSKQDADALVMQWRATPERVVYTPPLLLSGIGEQSATPPLSAPRGKISTPANTPVNTPQKRERDSSGFTDMATIAGTEELADMSMILATPRGTPQHKY